MWREFESSSFKASAFTFLAYDTVLNFASEVRSILTHPPINPDLALFVWEVSIHLEVWFPIRDLWSRTNMFLERDGDPSKFYTISPAMEHWPISCMLYLILH